MDQIKIGNFIRELRKERGFTQEQLAEHFNVSRRTVSCWETGSNMPGLDILIDMSDFYGVDLRELLDGERKSEKMDKDLEAAVLKAAEYSNSEKERTAKIMRIYFILGTISLIANAVMNFMELDQTFLTGFAKGATFGMALVAMVLGIVYTTGAMAKIHAFKMRLINRSAE